MSKKLKRCIEITRSLKPKMQDGKNFHASFLYDGPRLLSIGFNTYKHEHLAHKFGEYPPTRGGKNYKPCRHAESQCLNKLKKIPENFTMINVRIDNKNNVSMARPCKNCETLLKTFAPKRIIFTINQFTHGIIE